MAHHIDRQKSSQNYQFYQQSLPIDCDELGRHNIGRYYILAMAEEPDSHMRRQLINTTTLEVQAESSSPLPQLSFIERYNEVVSCYNKHVQGGSPQLQVMVAGLLARRIGWLLSVWVGWTVLGIGLLIPVVNVASLGALVGYWWQLRREGRKHTRNMERVSDPFEGYYYLPQMCQQMNKHHACLDLTHSQLAGFTFNRSLSAPLEEQVRRNNVRGEGAVIIYDQYFYDSFHLYPKEYNKTTIALTAGLLIAAGSTFLFLKLTGIA